MSQHQDDKPLSERVETWLAGQMPIIRMHGGTSAIQKADPETGEVIIELGGACEGCAISSRTAQNIKLDLVDAFPEVEDVIVRVADDGSDALGLEQAESFMGIDRNEGGRGGRGEGAPGVNDHR